MSCSQSVTCKDPGCFAGCCGVQCPPDGLCKSITICYECYGTDAAEPCPCVTKYSNLLGFLIKRKPNEKNVNYLPNTNEDLGIIDLPDLPNFNLDQNKIKIKDDSVFAFSQNCSIPCATICTTCVSGSKCGMTEGCEDYCDDCCCPCEGSVKCTTSGGGGCKVTEGWCGSINVGNPCCSCCEVSRNCDSGGSLWNKKELSSNKIKLVLNKSEFIKRINNMKKFRIARRKRKIR